MKSVLILGVGGTGSRAVNMLQKKINRMGKQEDVNIVSVVLDTNMADEKNIDTATIVSLSDNVTVRTVRERLGAKVCDDWFPTDPQFDTNNISIGAGQWRKQSYLAFLNAMAGKQKNNLDRALERLADKTNPSISIDIYTVASLAGGTGSGSFIPLTLYVKKRLREMFGEKTTIHARAMLACPDIYEGKQNDPLNITSIYANAYAILRELNAINQVVYGLNKADYDDGVGEVARRGRTPVRFRLGNEDSPVGVLFDSQDPRFHTPEAAPFERVCMMEKIVNVSSIIAHDEALANSLYSLICTKAGGELDGIWSNEEKKRANETGHNCMYAGIGSAEIQYPVDELMEYFAWRKTRDDAEGAWLTLHTATEEQIAEKRKLAKEMRKEYHLSTTDYAKLFIDAQKAEERTETSNVTELIRGATKYYEEKDGKIETKDVFKRYWDALAKELGSRVPDKAEAKTQIGEISPVGNTGFLASKDAKRGKAKNICSNAEEIYDILNEYYRSAVESIRSQLNVCTDAVLPMDVKKDPHANLALSFVENVLMRDGSYIHPVAAMVQLCTLRLAIAEKLSSLKGAEWKDVSSLEVGRLPMDLLACEEENGGQGDKARKSAYVAIGDDRFATLLGEEGQKKYQDASTEYAVDSAALTIDGISILDRLYSEAGQMLLRRVLTTLAERTETLIESYRSFFCRFAEQKERLADSVKRAEQNKASSADTSCVYVGASVEARRAHYERMMEESMSSDGEKIANHVAGESVFTVAYSMSCAKSGKGSTEERLDATSVFHTMHEANKAQLAANDYCIALKAKNVFEVIAEESGRGAYEAGKLAVSTAYEMAKPALQVATGGQHKNQAVVLVPKNLEAYLEKNGDLFGIATGGGDAKACADDLITRWCSEALVRVEDSVPENTLFICRALMSVNSVDIVKVNENSGEDGYYKRYLEAIKIGEEQKNDSMFPHLGFNWHRRGYLPFINSELEAAADEKMVKALLYAIMNGEITFASQYSDKAFRFAGEKIVGDGKFVDENNLLGMISWLRPQDDKIEKWSAAFDRNVEEQLKALPKTGFAHQIPEAKAALTTTAYLKRLRRNIFEVILKNSTGAAQTTLQKNLNMNLFEFAYRIKNEEEGMDGYDCNDAEKILKVGSDLLWYLCERVVSSEKDEFFEVYQWELDYFIAELYMDDDMPDRNRLDVVREMLHFANRAGCFMEIAPSTVPGQKWEKKPFDLGKFMEERADMIRRVQTSKEKAAGTAAATAQAPAAEPAQAPAAETTEE